MTDRRRTNGPPGGSDPVIFASYLGIGGRSVKRPSRTRSSDEVRKIFLKTGLTPSASGSAYLELSPSANTNETSTSLAPSSPALKLTCTVHGPRPLPRSAPFTPQIQLSTHIKFAPFAARQRRGYIRDASERDLAVHLETALRGVIIGNRWPKSIVEVVITVLEGEEDRWWGEESRGGTTGVGSVGGWGMMNVLAGCITVASAAIADAGIDCLDLVSGGVAAIVKNPQGRKKLPDGDTDMTEIGRNGQLQLVLDPAPPEHQEIYAACVVGYLSARDEITELWLKGNIPGTTDSSANNAQPQIVGVGNLVDKAVEAAIAVRLVLGEAVREATELKAKQNSGDKE
ncbi:MAG: 3'-5'-exoribonuclease [Trichoglossum hirsutum]|nr:MAG: 3'-5'-exoribonuclease [Trichoglossum hirsutum]